MSLSSLQRGSSLEAGSTLKRIVFQLKRERAEMMEIILKLKSLETSLCKFKTKILYRLLNLKRYPHPIF
jgi:hypothetical protein